LDEVTATLPSVVFVARDASLKDLLDVRVFEGDRLLASTLNGTSVFVNPGPHVFRFEAANGARAEQAVVVREGEKSRAIAVQLLIGRPDDAPRARNRVDAAEVTSDASARRPAAWIVGGVGLVSLGLGSYFGVEALVRRSDSDRDCPNNRCTAAGVALNNQARTDAWIANVGIAAGLVAVGVAVYLILTSKEPDRAGHAAPTRIAPAARPSAGRAAIDWTF
jgi:hypothetical protein